MKRQIRMLLVAALATLAFTLTGCVKKETLNVSNGSLWFSAAEGEQTIVVTSDVAWTIQQNAADNWYSVSPTSGKAGTTTLTIHADAYIGDDYRDARMTIVSEKRRTKVVVTITQNLLEFDNITNKVFGTKKVEHWNTDAFNALVEDSYKMAEYDPYDTATGYTMFFLEDNIGVQADHHKQPTVYYQFTYYFDAINRILHVEFESAVPGTMLVNNAQVVTASDQMFRFQHEYESRWWERAELKKIGTIHPDAKAALLRKTSPKKDGPIFEID
ncbi:MAG: BACON domain-containing protein [Bacteroidales bacterium]|nr:BACON domain-containing protein [Bacteroidales bacterium]